MTGFPEQSETFIAPFGYSLSLERTCRILGVSRRTVYYWIRDGRLSTFRTQLGSRRVLIDSVRLAYLQRI